MRRTALAVAAVLAIGTVAVSCSDHSPTSPLRPGLVSGNVLAGTCTTLSNLQSLTSTVFGAGSANATNALGQLNSLNTALQKGDTAGAQVQAQTLITFVQQNESALSSAAQAQAQVLIGGIKCYAGLLANTFLVYPTDQQQVIVSNSGEAGVLLAPNPVSQPTLITVTTIDTATTSPLVTKLDQYPSYVSITQLSGVPNSLVTPVVVAVCPGAGIPDSVRSRLRLGHQAESGFEVTPPADGSFLNCGGLASNNSHVPRWLRSLASLVLPKPLYARMRFAGGVGGSATEFSPFGPVDPVLNFSGGVGGTATEFKKSPASPGGVAPGTGAARAYGGISAQVAQIDCSQSLVGYAVIPQCRPQITLTTAKGTVMQNVPVMWAVAQGGGDAAMDSSVTRNCGFFGATAATTTNVNGKAGACWTLGTSVGTNLLTAMPTAGGDAPAGVIFSPAIDTFTVAGTKDAASLSLSGLAATYDGTPKSVSVATSPAGLSSVTVTYNGSTTPPTAAGSYTVVASLSNPTYAAPDATDAMVIARGAQASVIVSGANTLTFGSAAVALSASGGTGAGAVTFDAGASTGCSATAAGSVTATSGTGTCSIIATKAADDNYAAQASLPFAVAVGKASATLLLGTLAQPYTGAPVPVAVTTAPPGLTVVSVTYNGSATAPTAPGSYAVIASLANSNYSASNATGTLVIASAPQATLAVTGPTSLTFGVAPVQFGSTGGSGSGAVTFSAAGSTACSVTVAGLLTVTSGTGSCSIAAAKAGDATYAPATSAPFGITVAMAGQAPVGVVAPPSATYGAGTVQLSATGGSGTGAVTYSASTTPLACSVTPTTGVLTILLGAGNCVVSASKAGDANYLPATSPPASIALLKAAQSVAFSALGSHTYGDPSFTVGATATSGLPVSFAVGASDNCTISGSTVTITGSGSCTVTASQPGDASFYAAASPVAQGFTIAKLGATATAGSGTMNYGGTVPSLPCTITGLLAADAGTVTCTTIVPSIPSSGSYATTPSLSPPNPANYTVQGVNGTLTVTASYQQQACFASPIITSSSPPSTSGITKGTSVTVSCRLLNSSGVPVVTATGNLLVQDLGTNGLTSPPTTPAYSGTNVFTVSNDGDFSSDDGFYTYRLSTSSAAFIAGHYYLVTATWNDGSTTTGWIYLHP